jgi:predicted AlkP superfamily phosphohydrolase/phosphomutase
MTRHPVYLSLTVLLTAAVVLAISGCDSNPPVEGPPGPILVIGIDGAEWSVMEPLLEAGELPNLARLMADGASGPLRSLEPRRKSPVIWTTIATGRSPDDHGVGGFLVGDDQRGRTSYSHYSSNMWQAPAFWDIFGRHGFDVGVIAWLVTWPPWEVNGFMVSQHLQYLSDFYGADDGRGVTWPGELEEGITPFARGSSAITHDELARFVNEESELGMSALQEHYDTALRTALSGDESAMGVAGFLFAKHLPALSCVYIRGVDEVSHRFWIYEHEETLPPHDPQRPTTALLRKQAQALGGLVREYYRYTDEHVGRLLKIFPDETTVLVCSDHGFRGPGVWGEHRPWMGEDQHALDGVIIISGPGIERGASIEGATVYDIAPTLLTMAGLPVGEDMSGSPLSDVFTEEFSSTHGMTTITTYSQTVRDDTGPIESPVDEEVRERLRSLGYIQ